MKEQLIIKLKQPPNSFTVDLEDWVIKAKGYDDSEIGPLNAVLNKIHQDHSYARLYQSFSRFAALLRGPAGSDRRLALYFRLWIDRQHLDAVQNALRQSQLVERLTLAEPTKPADLSQGYVAPALVGGVNAQLTWNTELTGGRGENVQVCLIDSLFYKEHEDLPSDGMIDYVETPDPFVGEEKHGTLCLGVLVAKDTPTPVTGIVHKLDKCWVSSTTLLEEFQMQGATLPPQHVWDALDRALGAYNPLTGSHLLGPGDVLLVPHATTSEKPVETMEDIRDSFREAASRGIVVVEPAGNKGKSLDDYEYAPNVFNGPTEDDRHSHAVVVGAGHAFGSADFLHKCPSSNYGSRVDCQAWGEKVATTAAPAQAAGVAQSQSMYDLNFSGTSSASSIVAGVVAVVQSVCIATGRGAIPPLELRDLLRETGQPQPDDTEHIGPLPDLQELLYHLDLLPNCYLRDSPGDNGNPTIAVDPVTFESPDILVRREPIQGNPNEVFGALNWGTTNNEILRRGGKATVYLRVQNRGRHADKPKIKLFWSKSGSEENPDQWEVIDERVADVQKASSGNDRFVTTGIEWDPVPQLAHPCLIAVVESDFYKQPGFADPVLDESDLSFLRKYNKVAFRRVETESDHPGCPLALLLWLFGW